MNNKFWQHSEIKAFSLYTTSRYHAQMDHVEKMVVNECQFELERLEIKNTYKNRLMVIEDVKRRVISWLEEMNTPTEPITSEKLVAYRLPYLYFTRLYKK